MRMCVRARVCVYMYVYVCLWVHIYIREFVCIHVLEATTRCMCCVTYRPVRPGAYHLLFCYVCIFKNCKCTGHDNKKLTYLLTFLLIVMNSRVSCQCLYTRLCTDVILFSCAFIYILLHCNILQPM